MMHGNIRVDKVSNIREHIGVAPVEGEVREIEMVWGYGHIEQGSNKSSDK